MTDAPRTNSRSRTPLSPRFLAIPILALIFAVAGCSTSSNAAQAPTSSPTATKPTSSPTATQPSAEYRTLLDANGGSDPMMFVPSAGAPAGVSDLDVPYVAGFAQVSSDAPDDTVLYGADGKALAVTLGQWKQAAGTVSFACVDDKEEASSILTGLIPNGVYGAFAVDPSEPLDSRFTPWGAADGSDNSFTASADGTAAPVDIGPDCTNLPQHIGILWHSDGTSHGASSGTMGVDTHTSLLADPPSS
ncbi:MAG TPA: hypothetical protein VMK16_08520 [Acidimicrobiales bacterium]|nr:hypothetical protein [Acidimicrobiales bacterium]